MDTGRADDISVATPEARRLRWNSVRYVHGEKIERWLGTASDNSLIRSCGKRPAYLPPCAPRCSAQEEASNPLPRFVRIYRGLTGAQARRLPMPPSWAGPVVFRRLRAVRGRAECRTQ